MGIRESRERDLCDGYHTRFLVDETLTPAQRQYMHNTRDPNGWVWSAAYYSFKRGEAARQQEAERVAQQFGVTVEHLMEGQTKYIVGVLCGSR